MKKLLIITSLMLFSLSSFAQYSVLERSKKNRKIDLMIERGEDKNRLFEGMLIGYGALFAVANASGVSLNKFIIPAFIFTGVGITTLINDRRRKSDKCKK